MQHSLLPDLPIVDQLDVGAVYTAASDGIEVGGDWYDLVPVPPEGVTMNRFCHDLVQRVAPSGMDDVAVIAIRV